MSLALTNLSLARAHLDRAAELRADNQALDALFETGRIFQVHRGKFLFTDALQWLSPNTVPDGDRYFLGLDEHGVGYFAINSPFPEGFNCAHSLLVSFGRRSDGFCKLDELQEDAAGRD